jgi:hypothetical protein
MEIPVGYSWGVGGGVEGLVLSRLFLLLGWLLGGRIHMCEMSYRVIWLYIYVYMFLCFWIENVCLGGVVVGVGRRLKIYK